uniref:NADH dehydrogenase [ubiquinone] iron-sulfur protein 5 n=1 Tax=Sphenodon punctatus TaxID=8508 RepID=A0A8D0FYE4_SPHPU
MPFLDLQKTLGINMDQWMILQSSKQPYKKPARCTVFEKEWLECSSGIGLIRANKECSIEMEDFMECVQRAKMVKRMTTILRQKEKLMKEGKYTPPDHHQGKDEPRP